MLLVVVSKLSKLIMLQVVGRQFSGDEFKIQRKEVKLTPPVPDSDEEAEIRISFQSALGEGWVAANMSGHWEVRRVDMELALCLWIGIQKHIHIYHCF